ncbi:diguanylate cyclase domain-containing protein [Actinoplanes sp. CA-142083]|uniref:diguanylate cyclase domain-containing protein n=1 Tax=Actinoplanes sp. CA-142083 TaxID=3239903 RepID=UPI003D92702B
MPSVLKAFVTRTFEPLIAIPVVAVLHPYGYVGVAPLWFTLLPLFLFGAFQQPRVLRLLSPVLAACLHVLAVGWIIYVLGWGPVLPLAFALVVTHHLRRAGAAVWRPAVCWMFACIVAGQAGIALGWVHSYLPATQAQIAGFLGLLLTGMFIRALGQSAEQRETAEATLRDREERFRILVQDSLDVLSVLDELGRPTYLSPAIRQVTGFPVEYYDDGGYGAHVHPDDLDALTSALGVIYADPGSQQTVQVRIRHASGDWRWMEATLRDFRDKPAVGGVVTTFRDVTERRAIQDQLAYEARHDQLTGLINRAAFLDSVEHMPAAPAVLFIDLDGFKPINDTHGHRYGDAVLIAVAGILRRCISGADLAGRLGGDEFAIALASPSHALEVADAILAALRAPITVDGRLLEIRASVGIAVPDNEASVADLLHRADLAMYAAKRRGTHDAQLYDPDVVEESLQVARS